MKVEAGTVIESEFGIGPVVAITKEWIIHESEDGEQTVFIESGEYHIKVTEHVIGGGGQDVDDGMPKAGQWWVRKDEDLEWTPIYIVGYGTDGRLVYQPSANLVFSRCPKNFAKHYRHDPACKGWEDDET